MCYVITLFDHKVPTRPAVSDFVLVEDAFVTLKSYVTERIDLLCGGVVALLNLYGRQNPGKDDKRRDKRVRG
jgi:hypothetical protein